MARPTDSALPSAALHCPALPSTALQGDRCKAAGGDIDRGAKVDLTPPAIAVPVISARSGDPLISTVVLSKREGSSVGVSDVYSPNRTPTPGRRSASRPKSPDRTTATTGYPPVVG